jgi:hypothetical protein
VPPPAELSRYVIDPQTLVALGHALFWADWSLSPHRQRGNARAGAGVLRQNGDVPAGALGPGMGNIRLQTFIELLQGVGRDGSRAHAAAGCVP